MPYLQESLAGQRGADNDELWKDDTRKADDRAVLLKVRDSINGALDEAIFKKRLAKLQDLTTGKINGDVTKAVEVLASKVGVTENERSGILKSLIEGADLSRWGTLNAVTAQAHTANYDRAVEFETMGGRLIDLPANDWQEILQAA